MATVNTIVAKFDFKYSDSDWRKDRVETYQKSKEVATHYTVADGHVVQTIETTSTWASALSQISTTPITGPPFLYADENFYADAAFIFQTTQIKTTDYQEFSSTSYRVDVDTFDVLNNKHKHETFYIDGKIPLAPTKQSSLSNLVMRPLVGTLNVDCDSVPSTDPLDLPYVETETEMGRATKRKMQRDNATVRTLSMPLNPLMEIGDTVDLIIHERTIHAKHILTAFSQMISSQTGEARGDLELEFWPK